MVSSHGKTKITIITIIIMLVVILSYFSYVTFVPSKVTLPIGTNITVDDRGGADYTKIQDAINSANEGDTIFVYSGTYLENVVIDKRINLIGEEKDSTIIDGQKNSDVVYINASGVEVNSFTIQHAGNTISPHRDAGIDIDSCANVTITNCEMVNCNTGVYIHGVSSSNNHFLHCKISDHWIGFYIEGSLKNELLRCVISNNEGYGVWFDSSSNNTVSECMLSYSDRGIFFEDSSSYNEITKCNFSNNGLGITIAYYFTIGGFAGGEPCQENRIYLNNFIDNGKHARNRWSNYWDNGSEGNYWGDYVGEDANGDGIGDIVYEIHDWGRDHYPFVQPLDLWHPEEEKPTKETMKLPIIQLIIVCIMIGSIMVVVVTYMRKIGKQKDKLSQEYVSKKPIPIMVACPYCNTSFQITPTKKPFKAKCPKCGKVSVLR